MNILIQAKQQLIYYSQARFQVIDSSSTMTKWKVLPSLMTKQDSNYWLKYHNRVVPYSDTQKGAMEYF